VYVFPRKAGVFNEAEKMERVEKFLNRLERKGGVGEVVSADVVCLTPVMGIVRPAMDAIRPRGDGQVMIDVISGHDESRENLEPSGRNDCELDSILCPDNTHCSCLQIRYNHAAALAKSSLLRLREKRIILYKTSPLA
jgi:hypothetical protein